MGKAEIAQRIKSARINAGFTQKEVAEQLGLTPQAISNFERGKNGISNDILRSLCELYNISADVIIENAAVLSIAFSDDGKVVGLKKREHGPVPTWVRKNIEFTDKVWAELEGLPPEKRLGIIYNRMDEIQPLNIEFDIAKALYNHKREEAYILDGIVEALPADIVLRIMNIKSLLIAAVDANDNP